MNLTNLQNLISPPLHPQEIGDAKRWVKIEDALGTPLPYDYKALITAYGSGGFNDFFFVLNPFSSDENYNFFQQKKRVLNLYQSTHERYPEKAPYPIYPEVGGVLPCAITKNGDEFYWCVKGEPNRWPIVVFPARRFIHEEYELALTELLSCFLLGQIRSRIIPLPEKFDSGPEPQFRAI